MYTCIIYYAYIFPIRSFRIDSRLLISITRSKFILENRNFLFEEQLSGKFDNLIEKTNLRVLNPMSLNSFLK